MLLGKGLKYMLLEVLTDTDSGIFNHKPEVYGFTLEIRLFYPYGHRAMGTVIFERIVDDIHQNLFQLQWISNQSVMVKLCLIKSQPDSGFFRLNGQHHDAVFQYFMEVKGLLHHCRPSALQFADL